MRLGGLFLNITTVIISQMYLCVKWQVADEEYMVARVLDKKK